jgi:hypothetical protein
LNNQQNKPSSRMMARIMSIMAISSFLGSTKTSVPFWGRGSDAEKIKTALSRHADDRESTSRLSREQSKSIRKRAMERKKRRGYK